jgi:hypothetical protein
MDAPPCVVYPVGHALAGECIAPLDGMSAFAAQPSTPADMFGLPVPEGAGPATHPLCFVQKVAEAPGQDPLYRNWCHPDAMPQPLPDSPNVMLSSRRLVPLQPDTCPRGQTLALDMSSGRLGCSGALADPCRAALAATFSSDTGALTGYVCQPSAEPGAARMLPNPCPHGTWLMPAATDDGSAAAATPASFRCTNPCPQGQMAIADGSGAYVCAAMER